MNLLVRLNLALAMAFALAALSVGFACSSMLQANAKQQVMREAGLMLDSALAIRAYTVEEIDPLLDARMKTDFPPQTVPFYAATQNFLQLHESHPEYSYKEAALNPTNPRDRATDWESDLIQQFRNDARTQEISGERDTPTGRSLYMARPIRVQTDCLVCHSVPSAAPASLLARYGGNNGFGWQDREVVGAQVISVPFASAITNAERVLDHIVTAIVLIFAAALLIVNGVLYFLIVRPVRRIVGIADELSLGNMSAGEFPTRGSRELVALVRSFNRMRASLDKALKLLER